MNEHNKAYLLLILLFVSSLVILLFNKGGIVGYVTYETCPATIDSPGTYVLEADIPSGTSNCGTADGVHITASDVTLDCNNYNINGYSGQFTTGIVISEGLTTVRIKNCHINNFDTYISGPWEDCGNNYCDGSLCSGGSPCTETPDTTPPSIVIHSPLNTTYNSTSLELNVSADEVISSWIYSFDGGTTNISFSPNITISVQEGQTNLSVFASDTNSNWGSESVVFSVDVTAPHYESNITFGTFKRYRNFTINITNINDSHTIDRIVIESNHSG